jgi:hypothetical protein
MARVKSILRTSQGPQTPGNHQLVSTAKDPTNNPNMAEKRSAEDDIDTSQPKTARTSSPVGGVGGSLAAPAPSASSDTYRCFMQIYMQDVPWDPNGDKEAWMEMDLDHTHVRFDMQSGVNFLFYEDHFKIIPYGPMVPAILNADMCGFDIAPGYSMKWQYDHMFHYHYGTTKRAFMVAKMHMLKSNPPPFTKKDSPIIDAIMRGRFKIRGTPDLTMPCWFPLSQTERERDHWKNLCESMKQTHIQSLKNYNDLVEQNALLEKALLDSEAEVRLRTDALQSIDKALECAVCLNRFSSTGHCMMASCGHVLHTACHKEREARGTANVCVECRAPVSYWQDFRGFTAISDAITTLDTKLAEI